jgi:molecular chaperone DnaJ
LNSRGRGDLMARILVETPTRLSKDQKRLLEEFRDTETGDECPSVKSFFTRVRQMFA